MSAAPLEIHRIAGSIGAELHGVDLGGELSNATISAIRQALLDHLVIFFRDPDLPPARFLAFARRFGTPIEYPFVKGTDASPKSSTSPSWSTRLAISSTPRAPLMVSRGFLM